MQALKTYLTPRIKYITAASIAFLAFVSVFLYMFFTYKIVSVSADGSVYKVSLFGQATTADALAKAGIEIEAYDKVTPGVDCALKESDTVYVLREGLKATGKQNDSAAASTSTVPASAQKTSEAKAKSEVKAKDDAKTVSGHKYKKVLTVTATAYCSCKKCVGPYDGSRTADGSKPKAYHTIAAWKGLAFGTKVYIPHFDDASNEGVFEVEDRGGAITDNKIDIYFDTHEQALKFGRRNLKMYILE